MLELGTPLISSIQLSARSGFFTSSHVPVSMGWIPGVGRRPSRLVMAKPVARVHKLAAVLAGFG
ncbi:hypothetical protein AS9A_2753 [Hoyosella subflava DQS3-9A1]|uniref:Uncharacterized protein n=1 Tax=Hoyosella subflava (strain DSM 45089 / JCM 17490 / NBRC 109087 / DQS3-9A1) TaxID=443218 RepID=F6EI93_HOYSD|nr:hypothetical protein AS9A_2753 [Hoyosella subflava DQS3-9A1]